MTRFKELFVTVLLMEIALSRTADLPQPSYTRTVLKVSRSLPGETEELKVRTSEGNLATLIVKRRDRSSNFGDLQNVRSTDDLREGGQGLRKETTASESSAKLDNRNYEMQKKKDEDIRRLEEAQVEQIRTHFRNSEAVNRPAETKNLGQSDSKKIQYYDKEKEINYGNWTPLGERGKTVKDEETTEYLNWKPVQSNLKATTEERANYAKYENPEQQSGGVVLAKSIDNREQKDMNPDKIFGHQDIQYIFLPHQPRPLTRTNVGANLYKNRDAKNVPPEVIIRSEINVKSVPKRSTMVLDSDGTPVIHGKRVPDEPIDKIQTWRNARVIDNKLIPEGATTVTIKPSVNFYSTDNLGENQRFERFFKKVNQRYGRNFDQNERNVYFEWDPNNFQNEGLKTEIYETNNDHYNSNIHKRMLHPESMTNYPSSQIYTPESQKIAPVALKSAVRAPVLQYAHPELGVQPAKILKNEKRKPDNFPENQHSFTEQRQKKKYVLNDKNIVDSYTVKNYYPNQHFYGLKQPNDAPFWVKISENLKNQFSTGVEKVSELTRPVFDPLVEATHKISQNLGLSRAQEAQDKIATVTSGTSILIPALGLVASGAALGIGAVAVGRYLDVDVLKRSNDDDTELEHKRALQFSSEYSDDSPVHNQERGRSRSLDVTSDNVEYAKNLAAAREPVTEQIEPREEDGIFLVLEEPENTDRVENRETKPIVDEADYVETRRQRRSLDDLDVFKAEVDMQNLVRNKRFQRKDVTEIVQIDMPARGNIDVTELLVPNNDKVGSKDDGTILVVEDSKRPLKIPEKELHRMTIQDGNVVENVAKVIDDVLTRSSETLKDSGVEKRRSRRNAESDQELEDAFQNLENAEVFEVGHIAGDWTNTPCAKRIFCDAMIQRGPEAAIFMEKKMTSLLGLIQSEAAVQVSTHFEEVMEAVRRHNCSSFLCPQARPGNVFF